MFNIPQAYLLRNIKYYQCYQQSHILTQFLLKLYHVLNLKATQKLLHLPLNNNKNILLMKTFYITESSGTFLIHILRYKVTRQHSPTPQQS